MRSICKRSLILGVILAAVLIATHVPDALAQSKKFYVGYRSYHAKVSQTSTSAPTATVLYNQIGGTFTWAYTSAGLYTVTKAGGGLTANKTFIIIGSEGLAGRVSGVATNDSVCTFTTVDTTSNAVANAILTNALVEIRVYP